MSQPPATESVDPLPIKALVWDSHTERWAGTTSAGTTLRLEAITVHELYTRIYTHLQGEMAPREAARIVADIVFRPDLIADLTQHPEHYGPETDWCALAQRWPWAGQGA
ncbi:MAG TPA: hypothetical protein VKY74_11965 [Chloroflexia bacterium]|nr:hypothetical protein [Chloroflexia bacterium]